VVRVYTISAQGDEQIITFCTPGEPFPTAWIFGKAPSTVFYYEAMSDCLVAVVDRQDLLKFISSDPARINAMMDYFVTSYTASLLRINALEQAKAQGKLVSTLYYLCSRYASKEGRIVALPLNLTHQTLANLVGLTRETTATEINKLRKMGLITYKKQRYTIDQDRLLRFMGEESFRGLSLIE
jgi:CRP/FNR family transcriptional regulator, cyclic AMP receptor protein